VLANRRNETFTSGGLFCVVFRRDVDGFLSVHRKATIGEARAFQHGAKLSGKHEVYVWPLEFAKAQLHETDAEIKRAKRAVSMAQSRKRGKP
jgi:hypothetical protein